MEQPPVKPALRVRAPAAVRDVHRRVHSSGGEDAKGAQDGAVGMQPLFSGAWKNKFGFFFF